MEGARVLRVDFGPAEPELVVRVGRREQKLRVRLVLDASGRKTLLGRQLGLKRTDPVFDQYALHTWYSGFPRHDGVNPDHIHIHFLPDRATWVWQIPIDDDITSIGVVMQKRQLKAASSAGPAGREALFQQYIDTREDLAACLRRAERVRPLVEEADYSYAMSQFAGDRYLLLGDAARFVDPIFSSGVSVALNSARFATADALTALASNELGRSSFATFESTMMRGVRNWYEFIRLYYRLNVLFTHFIAHPDYRLDVLKLLQGDVYDDEPEVLERMRAKIRQVEANPGHVWHSLLGDLSADGLARAAG